MSEHVSSESHPELTEGQCCDVNREVDDWCRVEFGNHRVPSPLFATEEMRIRVSAYKYSVERIVAGVIKRGEMKNIERPEEFSQVCVWQGTLIEGKVDEFVAFMKDELNARVIYLEEIATLPGDGGPGGRNDVFFAVHNEDIGAFATERLAYGIRWIEDALSFANGEMLYPERVYAYRTRDSESEEEAP